MSQSTDSADRVIGDEEFFRLMVASVADYAIIMLDLEGRVASWNLGAERIKGYRATEIIGEHFSAFYPSDQVERGAPGEQLQIAARDGRYIDEGWRKRKDGSLFWANVTITAVRDEHGKLRGFAKLTRDLTERRQAEEALQRSQQRLRDVVNSAPNAMITIDAAGRIEMVNLQAERIFGYAREELIGRPVELLVPERFQAAHPGLRQSFFSEPQSRPMGAGRDLYALRKDGSEFPVEIGLNPIKTDEGVKVLSAIVDISARKRLEKRFRQVVESAPNAMVMVNATGLIEMVNAQAERVFGYARSEMLGQPMEMLVPERFRTAHPELRRSFFGDPRSRPMGAGRDLFALRKDGSEFPVEIGLNPIETDEGVKVLSAIVDISDRKQKEQRIHAALKEKDILLAEIHHRVKNNLQVVHSLLDLQSARISDATVREMLRDSQNRIKSMALIHQTLYQSNDFAEVDFGKFLETLIPTLVSSYAIAAPRVRVSFHADGMLLPINAAIPCGLVVNELVSNALKHAFPGDCPGEVEISLDTEAPGQAVLAVSDGGIGLPEDLEIRSATSLGLQLVTLLADQLGGEITVQRARPTRFQLRFPMSR